MVMKSLLVFGFLLACCLLEVSSRPNDELTKIELPLDESEEQVAEARDDTDRFIDLKENSSASKNNVNTQAIMDKIEAINNALKRPHRQQINYNKPKQTPVSYGIDREVLKKIQEIIASAKIKTTVGTKKHDNYYLSDDEDQVRLENSRSLQMIPNPINQPSTLAMPFPYIMNVPVVIMPSANNFKYGYDLNSLNSLENVQTRQEQPSPFPFLPSNFQWPFQLQWPFANFFPFILKDPFIALQQGGGWNNFFEYGQAADVCTRKQKSINENALDNDEEINKLLEMIALDEQTEDESVDPVIKTETRQSRVLKKRTVANNAPDQDAATPKKTHKIYVAKPVVTSKPPKRIYIEEEPQDNKSGATDGDLRFPFGGFDWFGNKKPVAPSPGFFINRLRVRKGGVAIAGPGGVATAGKGGTAIVGPGGLAYTQPGGLAVAGPAARVIALSSETDLNSVVTRLRKLNDTSDPLQQPIREGKVVATGPVIYYHPNEQT